MCSSKTSTQITQDLGDTLREFPAFYDIVKRLCREFKCGRQSSENKHAGGVANNPHHSRRY